MLSDLDLLDDQLVPERDLVVHRSTELDKLAAQLRPGPTLGPRPTTHLLGPSGSGKTLVAKLVLERIQRKTEIDQTAYINCWGDVTRHRLLQELVRHYSVPKPSNASSAELVDVLQDEPEHARVAVLDEVDQLAGIDVLYDLYQCPDLSLVLIANNEEMLWTGVDDRISSRVAAGKRIQFGGYQIPALIDILRERVDRIGGLEADNRVLERISQSADGNARRAILTLRVAAEEASGRSWVVTEEHVARAIPEAEQQLRRQHESRLGPHQQALYDALGEGGAMQMGELYERYEARVDEPRVRRTVRSYLAKLEEYDLIVAENEGGGRVYRRL